MFLFVVLPCAFTLILPCAVLPPFLPLYSIPSAAVFVCTVFLLSVTWTELLFNFIFPSAATLFLPHFRQSRTVLHGRDIPALDFCFRRSLDMDFRIFLCVDRHWLVIHFLDVQAASPPFVQKIAPKPFWLRCCNIFYKAFGIQPHFFCHTDFFISDTALFLRLIPHPILISGKALYRNGRLPSIVFIKKILCTL